jgi:hypothetical protein
VNLEHLKDPHGSIGNSMHIPNVGAVMKKEKIKEAQTTGNYDDYDEFQPFYQWEISSGDLPLILWPSQSC